MSLVRFDEWNVCFLNPKTKSINSGMNVDRRTYFVSFFLEVGKLAFCPNLLCGFLSFSISVFLSSEGDGSVDA